MAQEFAAKRTNLVQVEDPPFARDLFGSTRWAWLWLIIRLYLAYNWLEAGWEKLQSPAWMAGGAALKGFWAGALKGSPPGSPHPTIAFPFYQAFLQGMLNANAYTWFGPLIAIGEFLVGLGLLFGILTGIAAFFGGFLNWNFMMAGSASTNPGLFVLTILIILAWKTAGWWGGDRWVLPALGTPWQPGTLFKKKE
jgi:thiosulfate dehydrogenase (quinone) large subunit